MCSVSREQWHEVVITRLCQYTWIISRIPPIVTFTELVKKIFGVAQFWTTKDGSARKFPMSRHGGTVFKGRQTQSKNSLILITCSANIETARTGGCWIAVSQEPYCGRSYASQPNLSITEWHCSRNAQAPQIYFTQNLEIIGMTKLFRRTALDLTDIRSLVSTNMCLPLIPTTDRDGKPWKSTIA